MPQSFDALLFAHVIEHMDEPSAVGLLGEYLPYLKPGGHVFFICPQERDYASDETHVRFVDVDALADLSRKVGLEVVRTGSFPFPAARGRRSSTTSSPCWRGSPRPRRPDLRLQADLERPRSARQPLAGHVVDDVHAVRGLDLVHARAAPRRS